MPKVLTQEMCREFSKLDGMILVCAHYEGVDERFIELACDGEISIGNYILTILMSIQNIHQNEQIHVLI